MNARKLIASLTLLAAAGLANAAAEPPADETAAAAAERADKTPAAPRSEQLLARANTAQQGSDQAAALPRRAATAGVAGRSRAEVRAEAIEALKHHRSTLAEDLQLSNY
jgi:hypothetical protein